MDRNLQKILLILGFVLVFGGWQGLLNLGIVLWFLLGIIVLILVNFFMGDLILIGLKALFQKIVRKR